MIILTLLLIFIILFIASRLSDKRRSNFLAYTLLIILLGVSYYLNLPEEETDYYDCDGDGVFDIIYVIEIDKDAKRRMDAVEKIYNKLSPEEKNKLKENTKKRSTKDCARWKNTGQEIFRIKP